jgi:hypothetical protein
MAMPYLIADTLQQVGERHGESIVRFNEKPELGKKYLHAEKTRERLVAMKEREPERLSNYATGRVDGWNEAIDRIINEVLGDE